MLKRSFIAAAALLIAGGVFGQVAYRWVDEDGIVVFSDRPEPGAELVMLPQQSRSSRPSSRPAPTTSRSSRYSTSQQEKADNAPFAYESVEVSSPAAEETLWNIEGVVNVAVSLQPGLQPGHRVRAYFDGESRMVDGTRFQLEGAYRGTHNIQVEILDETGEMMIRSRPNRFYVQQNTIVRSPR